MTCLRIHPAVSVIPTRAGLLIRSDLATFQVTGADARAFLERLVPLLDGTRDRAAIQAALGDRSAASVAALLDQLLARGIVEAVTEDARDRGQRAFLRSWPGDAEARIRRLHGARVIVAGAARWAEIAAIELEAAGVPEIARSRDVCAAEEAIAARPAAALVVAAVVPEDTAAIERLSRAAHRAGVISLWAHAAGHTTTVGPLVVPGETACRLCVTEEAVNPPLRAGVRPARAAEQALLGHLVAMEAIKILTGYTPSRLGGRVLVEDPAAWTSSLHTVVRLPWCRVCGDGCH